MTRFIQQQIPPTPTRQVPQTTCPACLISVRSAAIAPQQPEVKPSKKKKK